MAYKYIKPIPDNAESLSSTELAALSKVWSERKASLQQSQEFDEFIKKLRREWAIETGIIERLYQWDRGVTEVLIEQGIDAALIAHRGGLRREEAEYVRNLIVDQQSIIEGLFDFVKGEQKLSEFFIRSMHQQFTAHQETTEAVTPDGQRIQIPLLKGEYKKQPNNPRRPDGQMYEYCPPGIVEEEMGRLLRWYQEAEGAYPPEGMSAWLHHRFTQIHPFQDGNGRVARALASLVFLKAGLFPLVVKDSDRTVYIEALEKADKDDLGPLVVLFARLQRDAILKALGIEQQVKQARHAEQIIFSAIKVLEERATAEVEKLNQVYQTAASLHSVAYERMRELAQQINQGFRSSSLSQNGNKYKAKVSHADESSAERSYYFQSQIVQVAQHLNYFAGLERYRSWVRLAITTEQTFELVLSFHGYGNWNNGIMAASAFTARRVPREGGGTETINTVPASVDLFQFNYAESQSQAEERFRDWLEDTLSLAMAEWKRSIEG
jgi:Fic family protein